MVTLASSMQAFESPLLWGTEPPKHIDDHTGCFGCWVESTHLFHSDCSFDTSSDHCHCWKIFQVHEKNQLFLWATMADTRLNSLALVHIHRDFRVYINSVIDSFNEKKKQENQTNLNGKTPPLNNFDMPRTLFRISKYNRLGTPPGVLSWAHGRVLCVFWVHKEKSVFSCEQGTHTEHLMNAPGVRRVIRMPETFTRSFVSTDMFCRMCSL